MNREQEERFTSLLSGSKTLVMGVCNITPDSFSDGGKFLAEDKAFEHCQKLFNSGADIVDIGGESTGPGSTPVNLEEELARVIPVVEKASKLGPISVDTYKAEVASEAIKNGATLINDVSGLKAEPKLAEVIASSATWLVLMHNKSETPLPHVKETKAIGEEIVGLIIDSLAKKVENATRLGIAKSKIILDPGMGAFVSQDPKHSWELLAKFDRITKEFSDFPVMVATSRKGFLGGKLEERDPISQYTASWASDRGAKIIRTHRPDLASSFLAAREKLSAS